LALDDVRGNLPSDRLIWRHTVRTIRGDSENARPIAGPKLIRIDRCALVRGATTIERK